MEPSWSEPKECERRDIYSVNCSCIAIIFAIRCYNIPYNTLLQDTIVHYNIQ